MAWKSRTFSFRNHAQVPVYILTYHALAGPFTYVPPTDSHSPSGDAVVPGPITILLFTLWQAWREVAQIV